MRTNDIMYTVVAGIVGGVMGVIIIFQTVVIAILLTRAQRRLVCCLGLANLFLLS